MTVPRSTLDVRSWTFDVRCSIEVRLAPPTMNPDHSTPADWHATLVFTTSILLLLAGCAHPIYETRLPENHFDHPCVSQFHLRKALGRSYQIEADKQFKTKLRLQMSQSKTNYPPFRPAP